MGSVYIPLEVVRRELDSKILLATQMASKSMSVVIGGKGPVFQYARQSNKPGIFFYKAVQEEYFNYFKEKDFIVSAQDEETGIPYKLYDDWVKYARPSLLKAGAADLFFTWGKDEYDFLIKQNVLNSTHIVNSGSPRACLWGNAGVRFYSDEIKSLKQKYGKFILVALTAPIEDYYFNHFVSKHIRNESDTEKSAKLSKDRYQTQIIVTLIKSLLQDFTCAVVIRPHPADSGNRWKKIARANSRIYVSLAGPSTPWIYASECVIHYGSTIGIESVVANKPTFDIKGGFLFKAPYQLRANWADQLSIQINDYDDLKSKLQDPAKNNSEMQNTEYLRNRLENIDNLDAVRLISNELLKLNEFRKLSLDARPKVNIKTYIFTRFLYWTLFFTNKRLYLHNKYKRPRITKKYVLSKVKASQDLLDIKDNIKVRTLADSCFLIYKSD